jgi:Na+-translocating ferredoxin:NAD+ oxidoreductase RnfD subunit
MTGARMKFFSTPKGLLILVLAALVVVGLPHEGIRQAAPGLAGAVIAAAIVDAIILRLRRKRWTVPDGAILSGLFVAMVLSAQQPWRYAAITAVVAVLSKYVFRSRAANVFNPAAFAIVATFFVFHTGQSWWGALPEVAPVLQLLMVAGGLFIVDRVNKMPLVLAFLGVFYALFSVTAFLGQPAQVSEVFRTPDLQAALFFAFFILSDPPTSPVRYRDQLVCGVLVALVSYAVFMWIGAVYYLLAGVLVGNVWEAWRRASRKMGLTFPSGLGGFVREISPWRAAAAPSRTAS